MVTEALGFFGPGRRIPLLLVEDIEDAATHVVDQLIKPEFVLLGQQQAVHAARCSSAQGGEERRGRSAKSLQDKVDGSLTSVTPDA